MRGGQPAEDRSGEAPRGSPAFGSHEGHLLSLERAMQSLRQRIHLFREPEQELLLSEFCAQAEGDINVMRESLVMLRKDVDNDIESSNDGDAVSTSPQTGEANPESFINEVDPGMMEALDELLQRPFDILTAESNAVAALGSPMPKRSRAERIAEAKASRQRSRSVDDTRVLTESFLNELRLVLPRYDRQ